MKFLQTYLHEILRPVILEIRPGGCDWGLGRYKGAGQDDVVADASEPQRMLSFKTQLGYASSLNAPPSH